MYDSHFGLSQRPFTAVPDSDCYFPASGHEQALGGLCKGLEMGEGLALLTGVPGSGQDICSSIAWSKGFPEVVPVVLDRGRLRDATALLQASSSTRGLPTRAGRNRSCV